MHFSSRTHVVFIYLCLSRFFEVRLCYKLNLYGFGEVVTRRKLQDYRNQISFSVKEEFEDPYSDLLNFNKQLDPVRV